VRSLLVHHLPGELLDFAELLVLGLFSSDFEGRLRVSLKRRQCFGCKLLGRDLLSKPRAADGSPCSKLRVKDGPAAAGVSGEQNALAGDDMPAAVVGGFDFRSIAKDHLAQSGGRGRAESDQDN